MKFTKMEGCGNDYIYVNAFKEKVKNPAALARRVADRHFGVGGDGLILIAPSKKADARMIMYNADGSEGEMCGNGVRCVAKYLYDRNLRRKDILNIETKAGLKEIAVKVKNGKVYSARVNMGIPVFEPGRIPAKFPGDRAVEAPLAVEGLAFKVTLVSMGNPHCVIFVDNVEKFDVHRLGPVIERHPLFPARINVEFVQVISKSEVRQRTWERGSGETLACGTGASAVCVAGVLTGRTGPKILNHLKGGDLTLEWGPPRGPVYMTGPAVEVFEGEIDA